MVRSLLGSSPLRLRGRVGGVIGRAAERINADFFSSQSFDVFDLRPRNNDVGAALGDRCKDFHRETPRRGSGEKRQNSRVIQLPGEQRGEHQVRAAESDEPNLQAFFFEEASLIRDNVR
jgi:hypothetical protein